MSSKKVDNINSEYCIFAGLHEEKNEGWVWTDNEKYSSGDYVEIKWKGNKIVCQIRKIDDNFIKIYNSSNITKQISTNNTATSSILIVSKYYRDKLGIKKNNLYNLEIKIVNNGYKKVSAMLNHPNDVVRLSMFLALVSCGLGIFGLALGIISIFT